MARKARILLHRVGFCPGVLARAPEAERESPLPVEAVYSRVMWPFRASERAPWIEEQLQRTHLVALDLERRISSVESAMQQLGEAISTARQIESRISKLELGLRQLIGAQQDDTSRLMARIEQVQGLAVGGRGGRPRNEEREAERQALELGRRVAEACQTPEGRAQLILELQGSNSGTVDPVGAKPWNPRLNAGPKPV